MLPFQFKVKMREKRGGLRTFDKQMEDLHGIATDDFLNFMINTKTIGIERALHIADMLTKPEQNKLVKWIETYSAKKDAIELEVYNIIDKR